MVDVEERALAALEEDDLVLVERVVEDQGGVRDERLDLLRVLEHLLDDLRGVDRAAVVQLGEQLVLALQRRLDLLDEDRLVVQVLDPDADAVDLVGVGRADAATRGADLALAEEPFRHLVEGDVVRGDQVGIAADQELRRVHAALVQPAQLGEQDRRVDDDTVSDHRGAPRGEDSGREEVERILGRPRRPCGRHCCRPGNAPRSPRIHRGGRWPFPCPRHPTEHRAAQVRAQAYTPSGWGMSKVRGRTPPHRCAPE